MIVISDASPITSLLQVGQCDLLESIFGDDLIPPAVDLELRRFHDALPRFIRVREAGDKQVAASLELHLGRGEAEAIALAMELQADFLLMDETLGRAAAENRGLKVIGLLGVLLLGKKAGAVASVTALVAKLQTEAGFYVSDHVKEVILKAAGEA